VANAVSLLTTELVANAVLHARTDLLLVVEVEPRLVRVTVSDGSTQLPVVRQYAADDVTGRGLALVELFAARWGVSVTDEGKSVWCEIVIPVHSAQEQPA